MGSENDIQSSPEISRQSGKFNLEIAFSERLPLETRRKAAFATLFKDSNLDAPFKLAKLEQKLSGENKDSLLTPETVEAYQTTVKGQPEEQRAKEFLMRLNKYGGNSQRALFELATEAATEIPSNFTEEERRKALITSKENRAHAFLELALFPESDSTWRGRLEKYSKTEGLNPQAAQALRDLAHLPTDETWREQLNSLIVGGAEFGKGAPQFTEVMKIVTEDSNGSLTPLGYYFEAEQLLDDAKKLRGGTVDEKINGFSELIIKFSESAHTNYEDYIHSLDQITPEHKKALVRHAPLRIKAARKFMEKGKYQVVDTILDEIPNSDETRKLRAENNLQRLLKTTMNQDEKRALIREVIKSTNAITVSPQEIARQRKEENPNVSTVIPQEIAELTDEVITKYGSDQTLAADVKLLYLIKARHELGKETPDLAAAELLLRQTLPVKDKADLTLAHELIKDIRTIQDDKIRQSMTLASIEYFDKKIKSAKSPEQKLSIAIEMDHLTRSLQTSLLDTYSANGSTHKDNLKRDTLEILSKIWQIQLDAEKSTGKTSNLEKFMTLIKTANDTLGTKYDEIPAYKEAKKILDEQTSETRKNNIQKIMEDPSTASDDDLRRLLVNPEDLKTSDLEQIVELAKKRELTKLVKDSEDLLITSYFNQLEGASGPLSAQQIKDTITNAKLLILKSYDNDQSDKNSERLAKILKLEANPPMSSKEPVEKKAKINKSRNWFRYLDLQNQTRLLAERLRNK